MPPPKVKHNIEILTESSNDITLQIIALILRHHKLIDCTRIIEAVGNKKLPPKLLNEYCHLFMMEGVDAEDAYRMFLSNNTLMGESQIINRCIKAIAEEYFAHNKSHECIKNDDAAETLFSTMTLLNTMHHNPNVSAHVIS